MGRSSHHIYSSINQAEQLIILSKGQISHTIELWLGLVPSVLLGELLEQEAVLTGPDRQGQVCAGCVGDGDEEEVVMELHCLVV